ncbi:MAG: Aspartyl/glutamyl-tRNA(Asn/Gln) amidotransferase subunit B [Parcubacteria group bacterium GW2011_GWF2_44_7]|nr:MAG: Aspartyl/glutamyl-tRNA(Asn/Gln) amidotransferase subunit B [Parcubacteria group bacterium GW2011_GWF2_44_7]
MKYEPIIGMEVHAELKTQSKMFCSCLNGLGLEKEPNVNICPVCTGQPGTLPVINEEAVKKVVKTALALNCEIPDFSKFDRKNYFYPDLPKGYQISQYDKPLSINGYLDIGGKRVRITRIHLEEDTGKLTHPAGEPYSLVDLNRAGVPLMELVTEPDIRSGVEARQFCQELQLILRYLEASDADMEKGQMRCEVNISLREVGADKFGTKVEIKNLNSFRVVERAIDYEIKRQSEALANGEKIIQETRGWDDIKGMTYSQRTKEEAHDYRYFPEPDLPPLDGMVEFSKKILSEIPELPAAKRKRFKEEYGLPLNDAEILINNKSLADYFENVVSEILAWSSQAEPVIESKKAIKLAANYLITEVPRIAKAAQILDYELKDRITPENFAEFNKMLVQGVLSSTGAQSTLKIMFASGADPSHIIKENDLAQVSDEEELNKIIGETLVQNAKAVGEYKDGKQNALMFLVGKVMAASKGKANPQLVMEIIKKQLNN